MLFKAEFWSPIRRGEVTVAFRTWKRPTVSEGGTLQSPVGVLSIDEVTPIDEADVTDADARAAGFGSSAEVLASVRPGDDRQLYRVRFHRAGDDPQEGWIKYLAGWLAKRKRKILPHSQPTRQ